MRKSSLISTACLLLGVPGATAAQGPAQGRPKLIVQITFDQLRGNLLERYRPAFTAGFKRVLDGGWWVKRGEAAHGITVSYPGHATLASGLYPSHHGLTANEWWQEVDGRWRSVGVVGDPSTRIVGRPDEEGLSRRQVQGTSLADWVKAQSPAAKTIAIGSESAIIYGGARPDGAYWFDGQAGGYTTSTAYSQTLPAWVQQLNSRIAALPKSWELQVPASLRTLADHPQQCPLVSPPAVFPHRYTAPTPAVAGSYLSWTDGTPLKDDELLRRVGELVDAEELGRDNVADYLALAVGSTDSVGHEYGPLSMEQLDTLLRLDAALGAMLDDLDKRLGKDGYVVGISADHGVADPPENKCLHRVNNAELEALLDRVEVIATAHQGSREALIEKIAAELRRAPFIGDVYTEARLSSPARDDWKAELMKRSFRPGHTTDLPLWSEKRRPHHPARYGISVQFKEGVVFHYATGVHGSPYDYDRLVPVLFYGAGVPHRELTTGGRTVDVAPTLASLAGVQRPGGLDGQSLLVPETAAGGN